MSLLLLLLLWEKINDLVIVYICCYITLNALIKFVKKVQIMLQ